MIYHDNAMWENKNFPNRIKEDEDIIFMVREDIILLLGKALSLFVVVLILLFGRLLVVGFSNDILFISLFDSAFYSINILLLTVFVLIFHNYYLSLQIVTTERVIDIDQKGLFTREVNDMPLSNIEDISYKQSGVFGTLFNFGNVILQTAGTGSGGDTSVEDKVNGFIFNNIPSPSETCDTITKLYHKNQGQEVREAAIENARAMKREMG
ncbi:PH domain-containing protein [Candidatus Gracilibacteria bacterium]|nr:PH domain-containing protein [Candidatus Gracilibacteria bacterium]